MKTETAFRKYFRTPFIVTCAMLLFILFALWQAGLQDGFGKAFCWIFYLGLLCISFLVLSIIALVRRARKKKSRNIVTILAVQLCSTPFWIPPVFKELSLRLNFIIYQHDREAIVSCIQHGMMDFEHPDANIHLKRGESKLVELPVQFRNTINMPVAEGVDHHQYYRLLVERTCDDDTLIHFDLDEEFFGDKFALMYSSNAPTQNPETTSDGKGTEMVSRVNGYKIERTIKDHWYYVRIKMPGLFDGIFNGWLRSPGSGSTAVPIESDGCGCK